MRRAASYSDLENMARVGDARRANPALSPVECVQQSSPTCSFPQLAGAAAPAPLGFEVDLPLPPSSNNLYANARGRGRVKAGPYKAWLYTAGWGLKLRRAAPVRGWYALFVRVPLKMRGDNHNRFKALGDLLVQHGLVDDDRFEFETHMIRDAAVSAGRCIVRVFPVSPAPDGGGCGPRPLLVSPQPAGAEAA